MSDVAVDDELVRISYESYRESIRSVLTGDSRGTVREWSELSRSVQRAWRSAIETAICRWEHVS